MLPLMLLVAEPEVDQRIVSYQDTFLHALCVIEICQDYDSFQPFKDKVKDTVAEIFIGVQTPDLLFLVYGRFLPPYLYFSATNDSLYLSPEKQE